MSYLKYLEAESIFILREVVAEFDSPVMLYSGGKDSAVMLRLALKAFAPSPIPFPLLHVDTTFKFKEMYHFRDRTAEEIGARLLVHVNREALEQTPRVDDWTCRKCAALLKTQGLRQGLIRFGFDAALGGARRDEEKSRAKERVFSLRDRHMQWHPEDQRPELWNLFNTRREAGESFRVFPLSNWTEIDVWQYIHLERIPIPRLYLAARRKVVRRDGILLPVGDLIHPQPGESVREITCRFRTLGCQFCSGAIPSRANTPQKIVMETLRAKTSERTHRMVDHGQACSMEAKKREGYF